MDPNLWKQTADLLARARTLPVQAVGRTRAISNVRLEPGRETTRIFQFGRNVPVVVLRRQSAAAPDAKRSEEASDTATDSKQGNENKENNEDWLLVLRTDAQPVRQTGASADSSAAGKVDSEPPIPIAGWVLARFIELEPPSPIGDYASSMPGRVVAWAALNTVPDPGGDKTQYVVVGTRGPEGQPCDFSWLRVYTWGAEQKRYETSYIENQLCGNMPIRVRQTPSGAEFQFTDQTDNQRTYRLMHTVVRKVNPNAAAAAHGKK